MPYKDKQRQRDYDRERMRRKRAKEKGLIPAKETKLIIDITGFTNAEINEIKATIERLKEVQHE